MMNSNRSSDLLHRFGPSLSGLMTFRQRFQSSLNVSPAATTQGPKTRCLFSSVSAAEVQKFSEFSESWWNPRANPLVAMNPIRIEYMKQHGRGKSHLPFSQLRALDVGCGGGLLSESLARLGAEVTAVDPSPELVQQAQQRAILDPRTENIDYRAGQTVEQLAEDESLQGHFDVICLLEVLEHVRDVDSVLSAIRGLLAVDGVLFLSTLNRTAASHITAIVGAEYLLRYLPVGTHDWHQFRSPKEVRMLMGNHGFDQKDISGIVLAAPPVQCRWNWKLDSDNTDINWIGSYQLLKEQESGGHR